MNGPKLESTELAFIIPHYGETEWSLEILARTLDGIAAQSDPDWRAIFVDDASPIPGLRARVQEIAAPLEGRFEAIFLDRNVGPGTARNLAVGRAVQLGILAVLYNDADDVSHPDRVATVRRIFAARPEVGLVYSTIQPIDEHDRCLPLDRLPIPILEIIESHRDPIQGMDAWVRIAGETGYTNPTSSTSIRTGLAVRHPFPVARASEDSHAWLRMSGGGAYFHYEPSIPSRYRIPSWATSQSSRDRLGQSRFHREKVRWDSAGLFEAVQLSFARGTLTEGQVPGIVERFYLRLAVTLERDGQTELAAALRRVSRRAYDEGFAVLAEDPASVLADEPVCGHEPAYSHEASPA